MEEGRILALSLAVSTIGLLLLVFLAATQEPASISSITPEDIGSRVYVKGEVSGLRTSTQGHMFFMLSDDGEGVKVVAFNDVAKELGCVEEGRNIELRGVVDEYHGEIEVIPAKAADVKC